MESEEFEVCVGLSRKWDAREAGREVAENTLKNLKNDPSFILLFSTIHYEKNGGFQEFLNGVWDVLPKDIPLIGGTVVGFTIPQGCFTRGATAMAVSYKSMDVAVGIGFNSKRNPRKAARNCAKMIKHQLDKSNYKNNIFFNFISGGKVPNVPYLGRKRVLKSKIFGRIGVLGFSFSTKYLQLGMGQEEEIIDELGKNLYDYTIIGGSAFDDYKVLKNFQFFGKKIYKNEIVGLGIKTNLNTKLESANGLKSTGIYFSPKFLKGYKSAIGKINGENATEKILDIMKWPNDYLNERIHSKTFYYPICYVKNENKFPTLMGAFYGNNIITTFSMQTDKMELETASGSSLIDAVNECIESNYIYKSKIKMALAIECASRLVTFGNKIYREKEILDDFFNIPYMILYAGGENIYKDGLASPLNMTFNLLTIYDDN